VRSATKLLLIPEWIVAVAAPTIGTPVIDEMLIAFTS